MKYNTDPAFVGLEKLKARHLEQLQQFRSWATAKQWNQIHLAHYDWWMFPIDAPSAYGFAWTVYDGDIANLKQDATYIDRYLEGVRLLAEAWGWDLLKRAYVPNPLPDQQWANWPIRLYKAARSVQLFGFEDYFESLKLYAQNLIRQKQSFWYNGRDLSELFD
jgi:hypothetical protein